MTEQIGYAKFTQSTDISHEMLRVVVGKGAPLNKMTEVLVSKSGVDASILLRVAKKANQSISVFTKDVGTTERTLRRHQKSGKMFDVAITQNVIGYAKIHDEGISYFKDKSRWSLWLETPNINFNGEKPRSVIDTQSGRELISSTLKKLEYGFTA